MELQTILEQDKKELDSLKSELLVTIFFGWLGAHKFYQKKYMAFIIYLFTMGIYGFGWLNDIWDITKKYLFQKKLYIFYSSEVFSSMVLNLKSNTSECNQLNQHIEELKKSYLIMQKSNTGQAIIQDYSKYNYSRIEWDKITYQDTVINCSASVCKNAQAQPFKYICKYFNIDINESSLEKFSQLFNDFSAAEEGKSLLLAERQKILDSIDNLVPEFIKKNDYIRFVNRVGFDNIDMSDLYFPRYKFLYVSPGGNSSITCEVILDLKNLSDFVNFLSEKIEFKKSVKGQRSLMNAKLRQYIKERDHYTCQLCGISTKDEPHLLLEIDHIKPISQGGITTEDNLQTLCWKCNRKKGAKILF